MVNSIGKKPRQKKNIDTSQQRGPDEETPNPRRTAQYERYRKTDPEWEEMIRPTNNRAKMIEKKKLRMNSSLKKRPVKMIMVSIPKVGSNCERKGNLI